MTTAKEIFLITMLSFGLTLLMYSTTDKLTDTHQDYSQPWDHHKYIYMAEHPFQFHLAPFCWRILQPWIVRALPFSLKLNFMLVAFISTVLSGIFIYLMLKSIGLRVSIAFLGILMFYSSSWAVKYPLFNFWVQDGFVLFLLATILYCLIGKKDIWFSVVLCIGVLAKEAVLFTAPLYYTFNARVVWDRIILKRTMLLIAPAIIVLGIVRFFIPALNSDTEYVSSLPKEVRILHSSPLQKNASAIQLHQTHYDYYELIKTIGLYRLMNIKYSELQRMTTRTFGVVLIFLPLVAFRENMRLFFKLFPLFLLTYMQLLFAVNIERLLIIVIPALILLSAKSIEYIIDNYKIHFMVFPVIFSTLIISNLVDNSPTPYQFGREWFVVCLVGSCYLLYRKHTWTIKQKQ